MNIRTQIFVIAIVVITMLMLINMIRKNKIELKYTLLWFVLEIGVLLLACFPNVALRMAELLGIGLPVNLLFFAGICLLIMIVFSLSVVVSKLSDKVKKLTQAIALLENRIKELEK